ncbi:MAG TPA: efflux RND transporter periplasmic adaptor subunit, partial [Chryseolinea sp.]
ANITTAPVSRTNIGQTTIINGTITVDKEKSVAINSRAAGRIERLFIKETGVAVRKGEPLYTLYSEFLLTLLQEYLLAKEQYESLGKSERRFKTFFEASEKKLLLYGLTKNQIDGLSKDSLVPRVTFVSPSSGVISEIKVDEGQYVEEGAPLYDVEDITSLWVEGELYPGEAAWVKPGDKILIRANGPDPLEARVDFISPQYRPGGQTMMMRAKFRNPELQVRPGQHAQVIFTHSSKVAIAVPTDAVIRNGQHTHVYVESGRAIFRPRMVKTGIEGIDHLEITEGLTEGDTIAVTGAYLLYSEIVLKKGNDPMAGHQH